VIPLELEVAGLHSYRDAQTVDFERAVEDGLFGIFGPTGSGKSTLLDAMTLALYGTVDRLGGREKTPMMHVDADELTVTYTFELGGTCYRAHRRFLRGSDGAATQRDAHLRDLDTEETLASQARAVTEAVEHRLGMDFDQFTRAVFLPQGKFARFLEDSSKRRLELLEEIFGLDRYGEALRERARDRRDAIRQRHDRLEGTLENELDDVDASTVEDLEEDLETVADRVEALAEREAELAEQAEAARNLQATLEELEDAREALADLEEREEAIDAKRERLERAEAAERPHGTLEDLDDAREQLEALHEELEELDATREARLEDLEEARSRRAERADELGEREATLDDARARLEALAGDADRLDDLREDRDKARATLDELAGERIEAPPDGLLDERDPDGLLTAIQAAQRARDRVERHEQALAEARGEQARARWQLLQHADALDDVQERIDDLEERHEAAEARLHEATVADAARGLVAELEDGEPCPVCGSPEHPDPASAPATPIDELEARRDELTDELADARDERARLEQAIATREDTHDEALDDAEDAREQLDEAREALAEAREALPEALREPTPAEARSTVRAWRRARRRRRAQDTIDDVEAQLDRARQRFQLVREALGLDADEPTEAALERARDRLDAEREQLEAEREQLVDRVEAAEDALDEVDEERSKLAGRVEQLEDNVGSLEERLADQLAASPFADADELREAHEPEADRTSLTETVEAFDDDLDDARKAVRRLEDEVEDAPFDPAEARETVEAHAEVDEQLGEARERRGQVHQRLARERKRLSKKQELEERLEELGTELTRAERLTQLLGGRKFVEYLARSRFEHVLDQASRRLAQVSGGQYHLEGSPSEIHVVDQMAGGEPRDLRTLSGGETFMVSLSLALALSDAIQHERGGGYPPIEFFFLDEGFGSLDQDTLDQVMRMLHELVEHEVNVGLITHVEEAQRYVPRRIEVDGATEERGSRVEVHT
jgi:exonuclease SbcC